MNPHPVRDIKDRLKERLKLAIPVKGPRKLTISNSAQDKDLRFPGLIGRRDFSPKWRFYPVGHIGAPVEAD
jgi:hypothetical protein